MSWSGLIDTAVVTVAARMSRLATSGIAAIRLKLATVRAAAEIRRALRMETSSSGAAGAGA
jgi:hypothetical protein